MKFKLKLVLFISFLALFISLTQVLAATVLLSPNSVVNNYTTTLFINCTTTLNTTTSATGYNVTIYYNASGGAVNTTRALVTIWNETDVDNVFNKTVSITSLTDAATYNFTCYANNGTDQEWSTNISGILLDSTAPEIPIYKSPNKTSKQAGNFSGTIYLNVSVADALVGLDSVFFNITNTSGKQVNWTQATVDGAGYAYVSYVTTSWASGKYNLTVYANDTLNNLNNTERTYIVFDNTAPNLSFSCTPNPVDEGSTITCSCIGSDLHSGFNSSSASFSSNPSTLNSGPHTIACSGYDFSRNLASTTFLYTVEGLSLSGTGSGSSSSSTPTEWIATFSSSTEQVQSESGYTRTLSNKQRVKVTIENQEHHVGITALSSSQANISVSSSPQQATLSIGEEKKFEVTDDEYYDLLVKLNSIENNKANLTLKSIHELKTVTASEDQDQTEDQTTPTSPTGESSINWVFWVALLILVIAGGSAIFLKSRKK